MSNLSIPDFHGLGDQLYHHARLQCDQEAKGLSALLARVEKCLQQAKKEIQQLPPNPAAKRREPDALEAIRALRPAAAGVARGPGKKTRRLWPQFSSAAYRDKVQGALLARMAGCTLGAPVEMWPIEKMERLAKENCDAFPPADYWSYVYEPGAVRYGVSTIHEYTRKGMNGAPVDDDIAYTLLGLLILEDYGTDFTIAQAGEAWVRYLPIACTAEDVALRNLKKGIAAEKVGEIDNPYCEWIGAAIRADPWAYAAPGWPERAAELAWRDAFLSHRRNGIYGEMFWAAAISAAFAVADPIEALEIGLAEIPRGCRLAREVRWALQTAPKIKNYKQARAAVDEHFPGMSCVHTINNACLTIFGIAIGGTDVTRVLAETVAMGLDNDCTAATAGSLVGAVVGARGVPEHWSRPFNGKVRSYLNGKRSFSIPGLVKRFERIARAVHGQEASTERKAR